MGCSGAVCFCMRSEADTACYVYPRIDAVPLLAHKVELCPTKVYLTKVRALKPPVLASSEKPWNDFPTDPKIAELERELGEPRQLLL